MVSGSELEPEPEPEPELERERERGRVLERGLELGRESAVALAPLAVSPALAARPGRR